MQRKTVRRVWLHCKDGGCPGRPRRYLRGPQMLGPSDPRLICGSGQNSTADTDGLSLHLHYSTPMVAILEGSQRRDIILGIGTALRALHRRMHFRYHHHIPRRSGIGSDSPRDTAGALVAGANCDVGKTLGVTLVTKLRAILLMEADFNATNKIIYGNRMMEKVREHALMPDDIFSKRNRMADDGTLSKTLFCDLARQARAPTAIASVDASNCYNRIAHAMASLVFQALLGLYNILDRYSRYLRTSTYVRK
jgi:hypothetical protein